MVWIQEMAKLVRYHVFNTGLRRCEQSRIERNYLAFGLARSPAGVHVANAYCWHGNVVFAEFRINGVNRLVERFKTQQI